MTSSNVLTHSIVTAYRGLPDLFLRRRRNKIFNLTLQQPQNYATVGKLISSIQKYPKAMLLLGQCEDRLPFLMQLGDPQLGAILVGTDPGCGRTHQLQVMVESAMRMNTTHELQVSILTYKPDEWGNFWRVSQREKYLYQLRAWYDPGAENLIDWFINSAEANQEGKNQGPAMLLILDDINFVEDLSYEAQLNLHWLITYGMQSGIWIAASIKANYTDKLRYWVDAFRTRIIGHIRSDKDAKILSTRDDAFAARLEPGFFRIWTGKGWVNYHLPLLGD